MIRHVSLLLLSRTLTIASRKRWNSKQIRTSALSLRMDLRKSPILGSVTTSELIFFFLESLNFAALFDLGGYIYCRKSWDVFGEATVNR